MDSDDKKKEIGGILLPLIDQVRLNHIKVRHWKIQLDNGDRIVSIFKDLKSLDFENTDIEDIERMQNRLRMMMNEVAENIGEIKEDMEFVEGIMDREGVPYK